VLADTEIPLEARVPVVPCRGGQALLRRLFEPLGYQIALTHHALDAAHPEWGPGTLFGLELVARTRLRDLLAHLYVLLPVLDDEKHYWVGSDEVEKLLRHGEGWLAKHPERELISRRYLKHRGSLVREALARLAEDDAVDPDVAEERHGSQEDALEAKVSLNDRRLDAVIATLHEEGARRVLDLGCGEGKLLRRLVADRAFERVVGLDVSHRSLEIAADRLDLEGLPPARRARIELLFGSLVYRDKRLSGFDAAALVEVIEHLDPPRLEAFTRVVFEHARPRSVVVTTPNAEYNVRFPNLPAGRFRHADHRFEWTRGEFERWARAVAERHGYAARFLPVGDVDAEVGPPTQMAVFRLPERAAEGASST
jgi:3' terminal RNA ribose 2'-O-methyltransferase Hen1